jgi:hypothetical protein
VRPSGGACDRCGFFLLEYIHYQVIIGIKREESLHAQ